MTMVYEIDPPRNNPVYEVEAEFLHETGSAVLVDVEGEEHWIPDSQIDSNSEIYVGCGMERGEMATLIIPEWLAQEKGII